MGVELLSRLPTRTPSRLPSHGPTDGVGGWWLSGSALDLDFANSRGYNSTALSSRTPDSILTYTSPSPKLVYGDDGVLGYGVAWGMRRIMQTRELELPHVFPM
jgi:hypothetical protein